MNYLAASIKSKGLLHNLVVVKNGSGYEVIDGNRRLEAMKHIYKDRDDIVVPCIVLDEFDQEAGLHANMMRENMHPLDECDVINALVSDGSEDYDSVGKRFGQTERWVKQRVLLADLSPKAKQMFRNYDFNISVAEALTLGSHEQQDEYLESHESYHAPSIKRQFTNAKIPFTAALFEIEDSDFSELGIEQDLFGGEQYITNRELFDVYQQAHIHKVLDEYRSQGYYDVIYLQDQYSYDNPETRRLNSVYEADKYDISDIILVVTYNSITYKLSSSEMVLPEIDKAKEQELVDNQDDEEEKALTPLDMSGPQKQSLYGYNADYVRDKLYEDYDMIRIGKALLCHRRLGYTQFQIGRIGSIYCDYQSPFTSEEQPDDYTTPIYEELIDNHVERSRIAFENDGTSHFDYCILLDDEELDSLFAAVCVTGLSRHDICSETFTNFIGPASERAKGWFKPDSKWLNKYKIEQLAMLEDYVFGKVQSGTKKQRTEALAKQLNETPIFNPFGDWPQFK